MILYLIRNDVLLNVKCKEGSIYNGRKQYKKASENREYDYTRVWGSTPE